MFTKKAITCRLSITQKEDQYKPVNEQEVGDANCELKNFKYVGYNKLKLLGRIYSNI